MPKKSTRKLSLNAEDNLTKFFTQHANNEVFKKIENKFNVTIKINHVGFLVVKGQKETSERIFNILVSLNQFKSDITIEDVKNYVLDGKPIEETTSSESKFIDWKKLTFKNKNGQNITVKPKTDNQGKFIEEMTNKRIVLCNGSSGSGKTLLAVAVALKYLEEGVIKKIYITRPYVPSENFGFLPGSAEEKMLPFLMPIYNLMDNLIGRERRELYMKKGMIEVLPIAFARGMNIGAMNSPEICIVDESENLNLRQIYLMISRLGDNPASKMFFCGDEYQSDLSNHDKNSLSKMEEILKESPYISFIKFNKNDVVRSKEVKDIVERFEKYEYENKSKKPGN